VSRTRTRTFLQGPGQGQGLDCQGPGPGLFLKDKDKDLSQPGMDTGRVRVGSRVRFKANLVGRVGSKFLKMRYFCLSVELSKYGYCSQH